MFDFDAQRTNRDRFLDCVKAYAFVVNIIREMQDSLAYQTKSVLTLVQETNGFFFLSKTRYKSYVL